MSSAYKKKVDKSTCTSVQILLDNKSKLKIIDKIKLHNNNLKKDSSNNPSKDGMFSFLSCV